MKTITYTIQDAEGIHARPAGALVSEAKKYSSQISMKNKGKVADVKRIFNIMSLCVKHGEEIVIEIEGTDEEQAFVGITKVLEQNL